MATLSFRNVKKTYAGNVPVIHGIDMDVKDGEFIVIVGPSGCGKSTLMRMVAGLETVTSGDIVIDDKVVNNLEPAERDIAMVFQNYALYPHMTVFENMAYGLKIRKFSKDEIKKRVDIAAQILELGHLLDRRPRALSGGQRQRVAMGRAIVREPKVFLFDEPLSNLDAKLRVAMRLEIMKLHRRLGTTSLYVTHDQVAPHDRHVPRRARADRHADGSVRKARLDVRGRLHRLAPDELDGSTGGRRRYRADGRRHAAGNLAAASALASARPQDHHGHASGAHAAEHARRAGRS